MSMTDPIADLLTRIRNGLHADKESVSMPHSKVKAAIAAVLKEEGYIEDFSEEGEGAARTLTIGLKYYQGQPVIEELHRVSKPGCRVYAGSDELPLVRGGLGVALVSTSRGIMTAKAARKAGVGGEVICSVF